MQQQSSHCFLTTIWEHLILDKGKQFWEQDGHVISHLQRVGLMREGNSQDVQEWRYHCQLSCYIASQAMSSALVLLCSFRTTNTLEVSRSRGVPWYSIQLQNLNLQVGCGFSKGFVRPMSEDMRVPSGQSSHRRKCYLRMMGSRWPRIPL